MKKLITTMIVVCSLCLATLSYAGQSEFCAGFEEGYKMIKGSNVMVPMCPMANMTPMNSTDFREGIKAGIKAARH